MQALRDWGQDAGIKGLRSRCMHLKDWGQDACFKVSSKITNISSKINYCSIFCLPSYVNKIKQTINQLRDCVKVKTLRDC